MKQELDQLQAIYDALVEFFVNYSFQLIGAIVILLVGLIIASRVARWIEKLCLRKNLDVTLSHFLASCARIAIVIAVAVMVLNNLGINITPLVAAIGAVSLGAGLAVQGLLSNFSAGLNIILTRPFVVGDTISVQGVTGVVKEVKLAYTLLNDEDDVQITIPNRHIVGEILHNSQSHKLAETIIGVAYGSDTDQVIGIIQSVLDGFMSSDGNKRQVGIDSFGDSSINIGIRLWVPTEQFHEMRFKLNTEVFKALKEANVEIPFPQREIKILDDSAGLT